MDVTEPTDRTAPSVRAHIARAVGRAQHVMLDFDGVMFDVRAAMGPEAREQAVTGLLMRREHRPRPLPITFAWFGIHQTLAFLAESEPDHAVEAEALISELELNAALTAKPARSLDQLLAACAATARKVAVISDLSEYAVLAALRAHTLDTHVSAVAARQGLDLSAVDAGCTAERAADLLGVPLASCLFVSGSFQRLRAAQRAGAIGLGCECGRDPRKRLADTQTPVVSNLTIMAQALLAP
jgi:beta-phosphoglucomutase-like phosphatase (HAD superfamily)